MVSHRHAAGGFAPDGDFAGVAAERGDVLLDPFECESLVSESEVRVSGAGYLA